MAKYKEEVCKYYECKGKCEKGRDSDHKGYCQKCSEYDPRINKKTRNRKKEELYKYEEKRVLKGE